jgi:hypothetical protein
MKLRGRKEPYLPTLLCPSGAVPFCSNDYRGFRFARGAGYASPVATNLCPSGAVPFCFNDYRGFRFARGAGYASPVATNLRPAGAVSDDRCRAGGRKARVLLHCKALD